MLTIIDCLGWNCEIMSCIQHWSTSLCVFETNFELQKSILLINTGVPVSMLVYICMCVSIHTMTYTCMCACAQTYTLMSYASMYMYTHTHICMHAHAPPYIYINTHMHSCEHTKMINTKIRLFLSSFCEQNACMLCSAVLVIQKVNDVHKCS